MEGKRGKDVKEKWDGGRIKVEKREKDGRKEREKGVVIKEEKGIGEYLIKGLREERRV